MQHLTNQDLHRWLEAVTAQPKHAQELLPWVEGKLRAFFPFTSLFMAHGELVAGQIKTTHWLSSGHDERYLQQLATTFELEQRGSLQWWLTHRQPFTIDPSSPPSFASPLEIQEIQAFALKNIAGHGVLNSRSNAGTYFGFTGVSAPLSDWHLEALRLVAPVLNDLFLAYICAQSPVFMFALQGLTSRQKDIVRQVAAGRDDKMVARQLGISEKTVRNQLSDIYAQLGINKRTQLVVLLRG